ncbi:hypothetical protein [Mesorhizobium sp. M1403]|uniref:hypothetical protein n=1 Tax=Mesorhizobium sp. M1403 TaxID=2957097 RepID=UPI0033361C14
MKNLLNLILGAVRPSTAKAIAGVTKAIDQLNAVVAYEDRKALLIEARIEVLEQLQGEAYVARDEAAKIAKRFTKLVA